MKRSEVLEIIDKAYAEFMDDWLENGTKAIGEEFENFVPLNERILQAIEKAGMSPPSYIGLMRDGSKFIRGENEGDTMLVSGRWEPEE